MGQLSPRMTEMRDEFWELVESWEEYWSKPKLSLSPTEARDQAIDTVWDAIRGGDHPELKPLLTYPEWVYEAGWIEEV